MRSETLVSYMKVKDISNKAISFLVDSGTSQLRITLSHSPVRTRLPIGLVLMMGAAMSTPNFSNFAHDCQETGFNGDLTTIIGTNCLSESSAPHSSWLSLDLCLSYQSPNLVAHQGYISRISHEKYERKDTEISVAAVVTSPPRSAPIATAPSTTTTVTVVPLTFGPGPALT